MSQTVSRKNTLIKAFKDAEVFLALKKMCQYVVNDAWNTSVGFDEVEAEYNLAIAKTKRHKKDVEQLAKLDTDLTWGDVKSYLGGNRFITSKQGDFNPWYNGDLTLQQLLDSMEGLAEFLSFSEPRSIEEAEYLHYYRYLQFMLIPAESLNKAPSRSITFESLHPKIKEHCASRYKSKNYSDAILTAYKVIFNELKNLTGIKNLDGKKLAEKVFALENPVIKLNELISESEQDEQKGFMLLLSGAAVGIRNPKGHDLVEQTDPYRTLEYLSFASLLFSRIDERKEIDPSALKRQSRHTDSGRRSRQTPNNSIEPPYVYTEGSFGGNGHVMGFRACQTYNLSDQFIFLDKMKLLDATIPFSNSLIKAGDSLRHTGVDGLSYPVSNKPQNLEIYFHSKNNSRFIARQPIKFEKRQGDGKFNIIGLGEPTISVDKSKAKK